MDIYNELQADIAKYSSVRADIDKKLAFLGDIDAAKKKAKEADTLLDAARKERASATQYAEAKTSEANDVAKRAYVYLKKTELALIEAEQAKIEAEVLRNWLKVDAEKRDQGLVEWCKSLKLQQASAQELRASLELSKQRLLDAVNQIRALADGI